MAAFHGHRAGRACRVAGTPAGPAGAAGRRVAGGLPEQGSRGAEPGTDGQLRTRGRESGAHDLYHMDGTVAGPAAASVCPENDGGGGEGRRTLVFPAGAGPDGPLDQLGEGGAAGPDRGAVFPPAGRCRRRSGGAGPVPGKGRKPPAPVDRARRADLVCRPPGVRGAGIRTVCRLPIYA